MDVSKYQHSDSVVVAAAPAAVYALVADVTNMGALSPVCQSAQWSGDERDRFTGTNVVGEREWTTQCRVDVAEAGKEFTFTNRGTDGDRDLVRWSYRFAPTDGGTEVTEVWQVLPEFVDQIQQLAPDADVGQILDGMVPGTQQGIATTLANLKALAEA